MDVQTHNICMWYEGKPWQWFPCKMHTILLDFMGGLIWNWAQYLKQRIFLYAPSDKNNIKGMFNLWVYYQLIFVPCGLQRLLQQLGRGAPLNTLPLRLMAWRSSDLFPVTAMVLQCTFLTKELTQPHNPLQFYTISFLLEESFIKVLGRPCNVPWEDSICK